MHRRSLFPSEGGRSLPELLTILALAALLVLVAAPAVSSLQRKAASGAAAWEWAATFRQLRQRAVAESRSYGVWFREGPEGWSWYVVRDGDGDGLRTRDLRSHVDELVGGPYRVSERWPGVELQVPSGEKRRGPPPSRARLTNGDPVRFGRSDLVAFSPKGASSSGTLYLASRGHHWAVVVYGPTVRVRRWYLSGAGWVQR